MTKSKKFLFQWEFHTWSNTENVILLTWHRFFFTFFLDQSDGNLFVTDVIRCEIEVIVFSSVRLLSNFNWALYHVNVQYAHTPRGSMSFIVSINLQDFFLLFFIRDDIKSHYYHHLFHILDYIQFYIILVRCQQSISTRTVCKRKIILLFLNFHTLYDAIVST